MANASLSLHVIGSVDLKLKKILYSKIKLSVMKNLCCEVILGHNFLQHHSYIEIPFGGLKLDLSICDLTMINVQYPLLFNNLTPDCKTITMKSRRYSLDNKLR